MNFVDLVSSFQYGLLPTGSFRIVPGDWYFDKTPTLHIACGVLMHCSFLHHISSSQHYCLHGTQTGAVIRQKPTSKRHPRRNIVLVHIDPPSIPVSPVRDNQDPVSKADAVNPESAQQYIRVPARTFVRLRSPRSAQRTALSSPYEYVVCCRRNGHLRTVKHGKPSKIL